MSQYQKTLAAPCEISGHGLHLGLPVSMKLLPAEPNTGFNFILKNGDGVTEIPLKREFLDLKPLRTAFIRNGRGVETVEHVLSAAFGMGVTNLTIEMDNVEPPTCDGSALEIVKAMREAGIVEQRERKKIFKVKKPITLNLEDGSGITVLPCDRGLKVSYILAGEGLPDQYVEYCHSEESYCEQIAPARTFCREFEVEQLKNMPNVGKGANEANTVLVKPGCEKELERIPNELACHKILDLLGDLCVLGSEIQGHIICRKTGHTANHGLVGELGKLECAETIKINELMKILPHSYPFLLVDRIVEFVKNEKVVGIKNVTVNEPFFTGHFPHDPIMPGVLIVEALGQTGAVFFYGNEEYANGKLIMLTGVDRVKFRNRVIPGDQLTLEVSLKNVKSRLGIVKGVAKVNGELACQAELKFMIVDR